MSTTHIYLNSPLFLLRHNTYFVFDVYHSRSSICICLYKYINTVHIWNFCYIKIFSLYFWKVIHSQGSKEYTVKSLPSIPVPQPPSSPPWKPQMSQRHDFILYPIRFYTYKSTKTMCFFTQIAVFCTHCFATYFFFTCYELEIIPRNITWREGASSFSF